jgi:hypothetical protein
MNDDEKTTKEVVAPSEPEIKPKTIGVILKGIFLVYFRSFFKFAITVGIFDAILLGTLYILSQMKLPTRGAAGFGIVMLILLVYVIMYELVYLTLIRVAVSYNLNGKSTISRSILFGWRKLASLFGVLGLLLILEIALSFVCIVLSLLYFFGLALLIVIILPILINLIVKWAFIFHAIVIEGKGPSEAFTRSSSLVRDYWWRTFGILLLIGIISGGIGYGLEYAFKFLGIYSQLIAMVITLPISIIGNTLLYYDLRARKETCSMKVALSELNINATPS